MDPLGTDSCRGTVPMEPPMSNSSMRHQNPDLDFDDTGHFLQGAIYTIAARILMRVCSDRRYIAKLCKYLYQENSIIFKITFP